MNNTSVPGLSGAVKLYTSDKLKERSQGLEQIKDIFDSRDNVTQFAESATREGGAGWITFFHCLFQVVSTEKKAVLKKAASAQADKRLSEAIGLVRRVAERTYHHLNKRPLLALVTHMITLLVYGGQMFPPAAVDYTKALKTLLSYPPHIEVLDKMTWKALVGVCWASLLGDPVRLTDQLDDAVEEEDELEGSDVDIKPSTATHGLNGQSRQKTLSTINSEIAGLLPILLSSNAAPLLSPLPEKGEPYTPEPSTGYNMLLKVVRFFQQYPNDNNAHLSVLQSLNAVLGELELNAREGMISAGVKLLPVLANLWTTRKKDVREQVLVALRITLPFVTHKLAVEHDKAGTVRESLSRIYDHLTKEGQLRWGCQPLDLSVIRLKCVSRKGKEKEDLSPFSTSCMSAGFDFSHESAISWAIVQLYADICYHLYDTLHSTQAMTPTTQPGNKRRRVESTISTLIANLDAGSMASRLLHVQVMTLLCEQHYSDLHLEAQVDIRKNLLELLDSDGVQVQSWTFVALAHLIAADHHYRERKRTSNTNDLDVEYGHGTEAMSADWDRVWAHATRKIAIPAVSRAAGHAAECLLACELAQTARHLEDIRTLLVNIEVQGPPMPLDSVCAFLCRAVTLARNDVTMYQQGLDDKVMNWLCKWSPIEGSRGKSRMDPLSAADLYRLLCETTRITPVSMSDVDVAELLPDCSIVERYLREAYDEPLRRLMLHARFPSKRHTSIPQNTDQGSAPVQAMPDPSSGSMGNLEGRPRVATMFLSKSLETAIRDWSEGSTSSALPAERVRKAIDLVVTSFAYLATLKSSGLHCDSACLQSAVRLLEVIRPALASQAYSLPAQRLIWAGFKPCSSTRSNPAATWPIMLEASVNNSGMRRALFPPDSQAEAAPDTSDNLQRLIWSDATMYAALKELSELALRAIESLSQITAQNGSATYATAIGNDDFGEINIAETDAMPQSREAIECRRTSSSLINILARFRVSGSLLTSPHGYAGRDAKLINIWLNTDGTKFIQTGNAICKILQAGLLRLSIDAVDLVIAALEEMVGSYAYTRDPALLEVTLAFLGASAAIWLSDETKSTDLPDRAIGLGRFLLVKTCKGQVASWRVRLAIMLSIDEYLDYENTASLWFQSTEDDDAMHVDGVDDNPFTFLTTMLNDVDSRVRVRAATSTAGICYLAGFSAQAQSTLYHQALARQSGHKDHWDSFKDHLLWKLNCCVASVPLRAVSIFHLYECPPTAPSIHQHFQAGMQAAAERLHLGSIAALFEPYAVVICYSQAVSGQKTLMQPFKLYGFPTKAAFGANLLRLVGSSVLTNEAGYTLFKDACDASSTPLEWAVTQALPAAVAAELADLCIQSSDPKTIDSGLAKKFSKMPGMRNAKQLHEVVTSHIDLVIANLLATLDLAGTVEDIAGIVGQHTIAPDGAEIFTDIIGIDETADETVKALDPAVSAPTILATLTYCSSRYPNIAPSKVVFLTLEMLFERMNTTPFAAEERRYWRALALVVALFPRSMTEPVILQTLLREVISRIGKTDYPEFALSMLQWCFDRVPPMTKVLDHLPDIMIHLGEVRHRLGQAGGVHQSTAEAMDDWLVRQIPTWIRDEAFCHSLNYAMAFWPEEITAMMKGWTDPTFVELVSIAGTAGSRTFSSMTLCSGLAREMRKGNRAEQGEIFVKRVFWLLKPTLSEKACTTHGVNGFLEMLARVNGDIHAPDLATADGLSADRASLGFQERLAGEPATMLRAILLAKVADLTRHNDETLRSTAIQVLRRSHATIRELLDRGLFGGGTTHPTPLLDLLLPKDGYHKPSETTLDVLVRDDSWVKLAARGMSWVSHISRLYCEVLANEDPLYVAFTPLLEYSNKQASDMFPWLVQALLSVGSAARPEIAAARAEVLSAYLTRVLRSASSSVETVQSTINAVLHLRSFSPSYRSGVMAFNHWLKIDPILLSEAANRCGAYATSLLFLETLKDDEDGAGLDLLDGRVQKIMYEIYSNVEDPDGFYGVQNNDVRGALLKRLQHEKLSQRAFGLHGAAYETDGRSRVGDQSVIPLLSNLHDMGFERLSTAVYQSSRLGERQDGDHDPLLLDLAWRTGDWDLPVPDKVVHTPHGSFYACLRAVHRQRDQQAVVTQVNKAIRTEISRMGQLGLEQMAQIKQSSSNLVCLREMALWLDDDTQQAIGTGNVDHASLQRLKTVDDTMDFSLAERLAATRLSLLQAAHARESKFLLGDLTTPSTEAIVGLQKSLYLQLGRLARQDGKLQAAVNAITAVQTLERRSSDSDEANDEFGHVLWAQKEHALAIQHVSQMASALEKAGNASGRLAVLLAQMAHWTSVAKMRAPQEIKATFDKAYNMTNASKLGPAEQARVCHEYALFADSHYQSLSRSPELERLRANRDHTQSVLETIESASKTSKSKSASARTDESRRQDVMEDDRALKDLERELTTFAKMAMKMFAMPLIYSNEFDDSTTRLCSLWLEHDMSEDVNRYFQGALSTIPSYKFIFLGPQLAARLYKPKQPTAFNKNLNDLMLRLSRDHPFHILYQVITVAQGSDAPSASSSRTKRTSDVSLLEGRAPAAQEILSRLKDDKERALARDAATNMTRMADVAVPWCHHQESEKRSSKTEPQMKQGTPLLAFADVKIPPPSVVLPVDISRKYSNVATLVRYRSHYKILGGIHRPKRMTCIDTQGQWHYELFKGDDELRQDAVMEQVFEMTNRILSRDRKTKARDLRFRTYAVIPLPNRSGIMEFVGDSQAIGEYLKPAHIKYRADIDHPPDHMRKKLEEIQTKDYTSNELTKRYTELMANFKPVMRHYFTEKHREPMAWFSMRLNYIRSVAVTSIVGHILGIGDRHCSNILIDKLTGELVHIDFGIVFEDGRRLRIPEKVPFRLTNDIVDGLGLTGVDGTFRQCSEHTLRVLRESADLILTVLEVFKHDPLYAWAADTEKLKRAQGGGRVEGQSATATEKADRVLSKIRQKLRPDLSVEYTVNQLIQEARDPDNLAKIFIGWQPWL